MCEVNYSLAKLSTMAETWLTERAAVPRDGTAARLPFVPRVPGVHLQHIRLQRNRRRRDPQATSDSSRRDSVNDQRRCQHQLRCAHGRPPCFLA